MSVIYHHACHQVTPQLRATPGSVLDKRERPKHALYV